MSRFATALVPLSMCSLMILSGCGAATSFSNPTASAMVTGKIFGGQQPVSGSIVSVWEVGVSGYGSPATRLARTSSGPDGTFSIPENAYTCTDGEQVYITASGGNAAPDYANPNIMLATGLGDCTAAQTATVEINEVTTVATAFALAQFFTPTLGLSSNDDFGTAAANLGAFTLSNKSTIPTLVDVPGGTVKPNASGITIEAAKIYTIANILAACVNDASTFSHCGTLFADTTPPSGTVPTDTLQAVVQMARYPYQKVADLFQLAGSKPPFVGLAVQPSDWTIGVAYSSSAYALGITGTATSATSASVDIDAAGHIWFPTNLSGNTGVAYFDPVSNTFNGPYVNGGVLTQPQYVAIDLNGLVWVTDPFSNLLGYDDTTNPGGGSSSGDIIIDSMVTLGPLAGDGAGEIVFAGTDSSGRTWANYESVEGITPQVFEIGNPATGILGVDDYMAASSSGSSTDCYLFSGGLHFYGDLVSTTDTCMSGGLAFGQGGVDLLMATTSLNQLCAESFGCSDVFPGEFHLPEGIATDGYGNEWVANSGNASVFTFGAFAGQGGYPATSTVDYVHDASNGNTMTKPYGIAIDGSGNVWIANAGCVTTSATECSPGAFVLSELIGAAGPTITPLAAQMVDDGALVGSLPGTPSPVSQTSGHPHRFGANARVLQQSSNLK